ncbi:plasmid stability protein [Cyanothece sp. BG0011]|uniref:FitA-like ribbon-helix-helix domain-containing protein n=1 Tax=Cyanothece sp. BG0011 TaxID=2082950 RepID=UPI000D1E4D3F|nr:plasmid stability protein [Cyanothece sp. BG0011]
MNKLILDNLDENLQVSLEKQAKENGRSLEEEAKEILRGVLLENPSHPRNLALAIKRRFAELGDFEIPTTSRDSMREPPNFEDLL